MVLYINFGCVLLLDEVIEVIILVVCYLLNLEFDLVSGKCGDCDDLIVGLICEFIGVEVVIVVNNNVVVVLLVLNSLGVCKEGIILCGELIEIGGVFCIFDIMVCVGVCLYEVGIINCIYVRDYEVVIGLCSGLLMCVYISNYSVQGFIVSVFIV